MVDCALETNVCETRSVTYNSLWCHEQDKIVYSGDFSSELVYSHWTGVAESEFIDYHGKPLKPRLLLPLPFPGGSPLTIALKWKEATTCCLSATNWPWWLVFNKLLESSWEPVPKPVWDSAGKKVGSHSHRTFLTV